MKSAKLLLYYYCESINQENNYSHSTWTQHGVQLKNKKTKNKRRWTVTSRVLLLIFFFNCRKVTLSWFTASLLVFTLGINRRMSVTQEDRCIMGGVVWPEPVRTVCCVCVHSMRWPWPRVGRHPSILSAVGEKEKY